MTASGANYIFYTISNNEEKPAAHLVTQPDKNLICCIICFYCVYEQKPKTQNLALE